MKFHDQTATLSVYQTNDGEIALSVENKRATKQLDGDAIYYGSTIILTKRQARRLAKELA